LDPTIPVDEPGLSTLDYLASRKGMAKSQVEEMTGHLKQLGQTVGIDFQWDKALIVHTENAHRLLHYAHTQHKANELKEILLEAHFTLGLNVQHIESLVSLATQVGLDAEEVRKVLHSDDFKYEFKQDIQDGLNLGLKGVPFFIFDRKYGISGAQPLEVFEQTLQQAYDAAQQAPKIEISSGPTCDIETGNCQ